MSGKINKENIDKVIHEMAKIGGQVKSLAQYAKNRFEQADEKTKKKILQGFVGATAVLTTIIGLRKIRKIRKKH